MLRHLCSFCAILISLQTTANADLTWPQFRGPEGQGHANAAGLPLEWDESTNIVWKSPIQGKGWSSPVVGGGVIWLTSATEVAASEEERKAKTAGSILENEMEVATSITLWLTKVDLATGEVLKQLKLTDVASPPPIHSLNSHASPTPVLTEGRIYCDFGDYGTFCIDTETDEIVWQQRIPVDHGVGPGSSPLVVDDLLILTCDGRQKQFIAALNTADGSLAWRTERPPIRQENPEFRKSYSTPLLINFAGEDQLVIPGAQWCIAYEPRTGKEIWRVDHGRGFSLSGRPVFDGKHVYFCNGFAGDQLWAIRPDGRGDVTESHVTWKVSKQIPNMSSPLIVGERIYTVSDGGIAQCFDTATGKGLWKKRVPGKYSASPLLADQRIYLCSHEGRTTVIAPGDEFEELAENQLDGQLMASPVVADGDLLLRTESHLYRIGE